MWTRADWQDFDRTFSTFDQLRRRMDEILQGVDHDGGWLAEARNMPRANLYDTGTALVAEMDVPGVSESDIQISATEDTLTVSGERKTQAKEFDGYSLHREERGEFKFSRSFALPSKVAADKATATVKQGVLTITIPKAAEAQPRQITVKASS